MIARKLYEGGYTDLVSVIPPDGVLATNSRIDPSQRGKVPGLLSSNGVQWYGYSFTKQKVAHEILDASEANIGLLGNNFPGLDIDVDDEQLAQVIQVQAFKFFGSAPIRVSRHPRLLLPYRTFEPFARMALKIEYKGKEHTVEVLGKGRQYVIHGTHPSGSEYGWLEAPLWEWALEDLGTMTKESVDKFFTHLEEVLGDRAVCRRVGDGTTKEENAPPQEELLAPSPGMVAELVATIPNTDKHFPERDDYILMGHAIKGAGGFVGDFAEWAWRWDGGENDPDVVQRDWDRMQTPFRVGWEWLQWKARELTEYQPAQDIFEADPNAGPPPAVDFSVSRQIDFSDEWAVSQILPKVRETVRYVPSNGSWYNWSGHLWVSGDGSLEHELVIRDNLRRLALHLRERAGEVVEEKLKKAMMAAARRLQNSAGIEAVTKLIKVHVSEPLTDFDVDPWKLNTPGGVLDLRTGDMTSVRKGDMFTRSTSVTPKKGKASLFRKFLRDLTGGDQDLIRFIQRLMGYCLTGDISEKVLAFAWGSDSDTGKSTFIRVMSLLFGNYADSVDVEAFITARTGGRVPDDIARLPGTRLVTATEPSAGQHWDEKTVKAITGGDEISARKLYKSWFTFKPQFKIVIVGNAQPELRNVDDAMLRRILIVPMNNKVPREEQIDNLSDRMVDEEGPAILHWLVQGCLAWASEGLGAPEAVQVQTARYKDTQDVMAQWLEEECELGEGDGTTDYDTSRKDLYTAWSIWCRGFDYRPGTGKTFKVNMDARSRDLGLTEVLVGRTRKRGYRGIRLRDMTAEEFQI